MATVYLHIGLPKTGTTAIQNLMWDNREILAKHGICYPDLGMRYRRVKYLRNAHFLLSACRQDPEDSEKLRIKDEYGQALEQLKKLGASFDKILLMDEALWHAKDGQPAFWERFRSDLEERGLSLRVIFYLRRQDHFTQSLYRQKVKAQLTDMTFHEFLESFMQTYPLDYYAYANSLSALLGRENLIVRIYEKEQYRGEEHNLFSDFLDIFGLSLSDGFTVQRSELNIPLDGSQLELQRILNALPAPEIHDRVLMQSFRNNRRIPKMGDASLEASFFSPGEQADFYGRFADSNSRFAREYLGREDGVLFLDTRINELPEYHADYETLLQDTILFYARSVCLLDERCKDLRRQVKQLTSELSDARDKLHSELSDTKSELRSTRSELRDVRENVVLYRLKRKIRHLSGRDNSK